MPDAAITDAGFRIEVTFVRKNDGVGIKLGRPDFANGLADDHPSGAYVDSIAADCALVNHARITDLLERVAELAADAREGSVDRAPVRCLGSSCRVASARSRDIDAAGEALRQDDRRARVLGAP